jgi:hypothetical protein
MVAEALVWDGTHADSKIPQKSYVNRIERGDRGWKQRLVLPIEAAVRMRNSLNEPKL